MRCGRAGHDLFSMAWGSFGQNVSVAKPELINEDKRRQAFGHVYELELTSADKRMYNMVTWPTPKQLIEGCYRLTHLICTGFSPWASENRVFRHLRRRRDRAKCNGSAAKPKVVYHTIA